jgi:hypothetical protein
VRRIGLASVVVSALLLAALAPGSVAASVKRIYYRGAAGGPSKTVLHAGGLRLTAQCASGMSGAVLSVTASSDVADASIHANEQPGDSSPGDYTENDDLMVGDPLPIYGSGGMPLTAFAAGQIVYSKPTRGAVSVDFIAAQNGGEANICRFAGTARVAPRGTGLVYYRASPGAPPVKFFDRGGLVLRGICSGTDVMTVRARTRGERATIHSNGQYLSPGIDYSEDNHLSPGETFDLGTAADSEAGQLIYSRPDGRTLTIDFLSEEDIYGEPGCAFAGTDDVAGPRNRNDVYYAKDAPRPRKRFFHRGGVSFNATCNAGPSLLANIGIRDSTLAVSELAEQFAASPGATFSAGAGTSGGDTIGGVFGADADSGELVVARQSDRSVTSVEYLAEEGNGNGGRPDCLVAGTARVLKP